MTTALSLLKLLMTGETVAAVQAATPADPASPKVEEHLNCRVCGESFPVLGRHIHAAHQMDEPTYRRTFGLPAEEPLVSAGYLARKRRCIEAYGGRLRPSFGTGH